jgi:hypothetical protein
MTETEKAEFDRIKAERADLIREKAERELEWREFVRTTLESQGVKLSNIKEVLDKIDRENLPKRVRVLEDFKLTSAAWAAGATFIIILGWRAFEYFSQK